MLKEFKEFALKGNMMDLAVGVIIGGAFQGLVTSLVDNIIMPVVSIFTGGIDFSSWAIVIGEGETAAKINYGTFISEIINFIIMAFVIFLMVKGMNKLRKPVEEEVTTKTCPFCKTDIALDATRCPNCTSEVE